MALVPGAAPAAQWPRAGQAVCFTRGRISFLRPDGSTGSNTTGQAIFYFGPHVDRFREAMRDLGHTFENGAGKSPAAGGPAAHQD